jgi:hypothetical protein
MFKNLLRVISYCLKLGVSISFLKEFVGDRAVYFVVNLSLLLNYIVAI